MIEIMDRLHKDTLPSVITPMDMLHNAVSQGANIDVLEKLMLLHERYEASVARKAFDAAMAEAKSHMTLHGLRHTLGTMLKEAGTPDGDIADVLGQSSTAMARHYSREAKLPSKTRGIVMGLKLIGKKK